MFIMVSEWTYASLIQKRLWIMSHIDTLLASSANGIFYGICLWQCQTLESHLSSTPLCLYSELINLMFQQIKTPSGHFWTWAGPLSLSWLKSTSLTLPNRWLGDNGLHVTPIQVQVTLFLHLWPTPLWHSMMSAPIWIVWQHFLTFPVGIYNMQMSHDPFCIDNLELSYHRVTTILTYLLPRHRVLISIV